MEALSLPSESCYSSLLSAEGLRWQTVTGDHAEVCVTEARAPDSLGDALRDVPFWHSWWMWRPGSSVLGISQERILEWVAISFSRGSSWPRDWTWVFCITGRFFTTWGTREPHLEACRILNLPWKAVALAVVLPPPHFTPLWDQSKEYLVSDPHRGREIQKRGKRCHGWQRGFPTPWLSWKRLLLEAGCVEHKEECEPWTFISSP